MQEALFEQAVTLAQQLSPELRARLIRQLQKMPMPVSLRSPIGICADLGPAPSKEVIDQERREMWRTFYE